MPTRRTSPRRQVTRPAAVPPRAVETYDEYDDEPPGILETAGPWLALLAIVLAAGAVAFVVLGRSSGEDLTACRTAAWGAIPAKAALPKTWSIGSTDLSANGM